MKRILIFICLLASGFAYAQAAKTFSWTPPTEYDDGTVLPDSDIASYNLTCNGTLLANIPNSGGTDTYVSGTLAPGDYSCSATTVAANGQESLASNTANFTVDPLVPGAPTGFTVNF